MLILYPAGLCSNCSRTDDTSLSCIGLRFMMERYCAIIGRGRQIFGSESTGLPLRVIRCSNPVQLSQPPTRARPSDHLIDLRSRVDLDKGNHGKRSKDTQSLGASYVLKVVSRFSKKKRCMTVNSGGKLEQ